MPTAPPSSRVLVTGANGFLATWVIKTLLERGYSVLGAVRTEAKGNHLREIFKSYGNKFQFGAVGDMVNETAFDEVVKDVSAVIHTASPCHTTADDPQELIGPAIGGTVSVLKSCLKNGHSVKRVVMTSTTGAIREFADEPSIFNETHWSDKAVEDVEKNGRGATPMHKYMASKNKAERAAWDFVEDHKSEIGWDLTTLQPPYIFGAPLHEVTDPNALNTSMSVFWKMTLPSSNFTPEELATSRGGFIDVRDIALAHVLALEKEQAGGERIIIYARPWTYQDFLDAAHSLSPPAITREVPVGVPGSGRNVTHIVEYENAKMKRLLGIEPRSIEEVTRGVLEDFERRGW